MFRKKTLAYLLFDPSGKLVNFCSRNFLITFGIVCSSGKGSEIETEFELLVHFGRFKKKIKNSLKNLSALYFKFFFFHTTLLKVKQE